MTHTLMKYLMIAAVAPSLALAQEPPAPRARPTPPAPAPKTRPAVPAAPERPFDWPVPMIEPRFDYDFNYDFKFDMAPKLEDMKFKLDEMRAEHLLDLAPRLEDMKFHLDDIRAEQMAKAAEVAERVKVDIQPQVQVALEKAREQMDRAREDMQRSLDVSRNFKTQSFEYSRPRQAWAQEDPADSLYRAARESLNRGEYRKAVQLFSDVTRRFPKSKYALDCQYWEAFSRYRAGTTDDLRQAAKLLEDPKMAAVRSNEYNMDVPGLRARIYGALAARGDANAARQLQVEAAQSTSCDREEVSVRAEALGALGQMDPTSALPAVKKVLARRDDCTVELRRRALYILGRQPNAEAISLMLDVAKNDTDQGIRRDAMSWLSRTAGDQAVPMLEELLRTSTDEQTQRSAVSALGSIDTDAARKAVRAIIERTDVQERVRAEAISSLARDRDNRAITTDDQAYLRSLYTKVETPRLKEAVLSAVSRIEAPENEAWLLAIAKNANESPSMRAQALQRLGRMTTVSFAEIGKLYEVADSRELRQQILRALAERKEPEAIDKLVEVAKKDTDPNIRRYAISILSRSNNPKAIQGIKDLVETP